ncbi:iron chelate uptake ABC transporter family permease subunit [Sphingobacterium sp. MYb382]|uniref:iron chelate uptake ABC transporter family permease subunit n=1 Tax=Sphingobacterium sp. MYb382 TaxID=2745278 RepID=UPI0030A50342
MMQSNKQKLAWIGLFLAVLCVAFLFYGVKGNYTYVLSRRGIRLGSMLVVGVSVGCASLIFQTITNNRILTPSIMGYESIFILFQTIIVFVLGDRAFQSISSEANFFYAVMLMLAFSAFMYFLMFAKQKKNMYYLLLVGMIMGTLFQALSQFMHILVDPNEFSVIMNFMFVSFSKMNTTLLSIALGTLLVALVYLLPQLRYFDVLRLGKDQAVSLGVDYNKLIKKAMIIVAVLVSVSTALVGPITFLGILVTNLSYELFKTYKHAILLVGCSLVACVSLVLGQFLVEHILPFSTTVSIVINGIGGVYFLYILWRTSKAVR